MATYNLDSNGNPIPLTIPNGAVIVEATDSVIKWTVPGTRGTFSTTDAQKIQQYKDVQAQYASTEGSNTQTATTSSTATSASTPTVLGTFSSGQVGVREEDLMQFLETHSYSDIPKEFTQNMVLLDAGVTNIDWKNGIYQRKTSSGTRYTFLRTNGSYSTSAGSLSEAKQKAQAKGYDNYLYLGGSTYTGSIGAGVVPNYTGQAQANVDNTTNVPDASMPQVDNTVLTNSAEFKALPADQQEVVKQVYDLIASNNQEQAQKLAAAFKTSAAISDPFFKQELRLAADAIERGYVSIDKEEEFKLQQIQNRKSDLEQDIATQRGFLTLEEQSALRGIDREFDQQIKQTRQTMASRGFSSSSRRAETEQLLNEATGDLRESTKRKFGLQQGELQRTLERSTRDTQSEIARLRELTQENRLDFLRQAESNVGTDNLKTALPNLNSSDVLGGITGDIPRQQTSDIIAGAQNLIF